MNSVQAIRFVCQRCMATTRIPLPNGETRDPVPWGEDDEVKWLGGKVLCPHSGVTISHSRVPNCLRAGEVHAAESGVLVVLDEQEVQEVQMASSDL